MSFIVLNFLIQIYNTRWAYAKISSYFPITNIGAYYLKKKNPGYEQLFILYYLPEMEVGNGAYATTHFTPELSIGLVGSDDFEREIEEANRRKVVETGEVVGKWAPEGVS